MREGRWGTQGQRIHPVALTHSLWVHQPGGRAQATPEQVDIGLRPRGEGSGNDGHWHEVDRRPGQVGRWPGQMAGLHPGGQGRHLPSVPGDAEWGPGQGRRPAQDARCSAQDQPAAPRRHCLHGHQCPAPSWLHAERPSPGWARAACGPSSALAGRATRGLSSTASVTAGAPLPQAQETSAGRSLLSKPAPLPPLLPPQRRPSPHGL